MINPKQDKHMRRYGRDVTYGDKITLNGKRGKVVKISDLHGDYTLEFDDGSTITVPYKKLFEEKINKSKFQEYLETIKNNETDKNKSKDSNLSLEEIEAREKRRKARRRERNQKIIDQEMER